MHSKINPGCFTYLPPASVSAVKRRSPPKTRLPPAHLRQTHWWVSTFYNVKKHIVYYLIYLTLSSCYPDGHAAEASGVSQLHRVSRARKQSGSHPSSYTLTITWDYLWHYRLSPSPWDHFVCQWWYVMHRKDLHRRSLKRHFERSQ